MLRHPYPGNGAVDHHEFDGPRGVLAAQPLPYPARGLAPIVSVSRIIIQPLLDKGGGTGPAG